MLAAAYVFLVPFGALGLAVVTRAKGPLGFALCALGSAFCALVWLEAARAIFLWMRAP